MGARVRFIYENNLLKNMMDKVLVLDVDETLLNMEPLFFLEKFKKNYKDYKGKLIFDRYYLSPRPNIETFINEVKRNFQLVAFSTANKEATIQKLTAIGILNDFIRVYGKENLQDKKKSLRLIAKDLKVDLNNIVGIDDVPESFFEKERIIKIKPWFIGDDKNDEELIAVSKNLELNFAKISS